MRTYRYTSLHICIRTYRQRDRQTDTYTTNKRRYVDTYLHPYIHTLYVSTCVPQIDMPRYVRGYIAPRSLVLTLALAFLLFALNLPASGGPDRNMMAPVLPWYSWSTVRLFVFRRAAQEWSLSSGIEHSKFEGSFRHFFTISRYRCIGLSEDPEPWVLAHHRPRLSTTRCWQNDDQTRSLARRVGG